MCSNKMRFPNAQNENDRELPTVLITKKYDKSYGRHPVPPGSIAQRLTVCNNLTVLIAKRKNRNRLMVLIAKIRGKSYGRRSRAARFARRGV